MIITQNTIDLLNKRRIFSTYNGMCRFRVGEDVKFASNVEIEPYTCYFTGNVLFQMGSFSYSFSQLPVDTIIKRYCSIAKGTHLFGTKHPYERFTNSSITYDAGFCILKECLNDCGIQNRGG